MAEDVRITSMPGSGSAERIALELAEKIREAEHPYGKGPIPEARQYWLDLYADCLYATRGYRDAKSR